MAHYRIEYSKKENGWVPKKTGSEYIFRRVSNSPLFSTIEEAEKWIRETDSKAQWVEHQIGDCTGSLMTLKEWEHDCYHGFLIDYDGFGDLVDLHYNIISGGCSVAPSDYTSGNLTYPPEAKYILWYNR